MRCSMSLATACHPASRNPATTGTQESVCSLCGQLHIFSPPSKKKKKKTATKVRPLSHPSSNHEVEQGQSWKTPGLAEQRGMGGQASVWQLHVFQFLSVKEGNGWLHEQQPQHWRRIVLSLQEEGKPRTNLTWFSPQGDCSPVQGCHSHATHWAELQMEIRPLSKCLKSGLIPEQYKPRILKKHNPLGLSPSAS